ncbi:FAD/NAD(P)-binding domain-containing protein [Neoconidiobolus thromboides FSU 785]|nr:FAD/NAD(P)-binding domain-containing protein [Neoconidiobolus thromboides FSU 785]
MTSPPKDYKGKMISLDKDPAEYIEKDDILVEEKQNSNINTHTISQDLQLEKVDDSKDTIVDSKNVAEKVSEVQEKINEGISKATEAISEKVEEIKDQASEKANEALKVLEEKVTVSEDAEVASELKAPIEPKQTILPLEGEDKKDQRAKVYYKYILVGGGTATFSAMKAIKQKDPEADILIVSEEVVAPYMRPPLSKELWFSEDPKVGETLNFKDWQGTERHLVYGKKEDYETVDKDTLYASNDKKTKIILGAAVSKLNVERKVITLNNDKRIAYGKLLIATGGTPKTLPVVQSAPETIKNKISTYRNIADFRTLDELTASGKHVAVIGGGFLGSELAYALATRGKKSDTKVTQLFPESGNMANVFPAYLTAWSTKKIQDEGVTICANSKVSELKESTGGKVEIHLQDGNKVEVDHVVVAVGISPNDKLAKEAGLEIDEKRGGILVNAELESRGDVFAAGDVSSYHDIALGRRRVEHHDHAALSGRHAGENMVGPKRAYTHQSMFWSDLGPKIGYEAIGLVDSQLETSGVWVRNKDSNEKEYNKGLVFYFREDRLVGVMLWNLFNKVDTARDLIRLNKFSSKQVNELAAQFDLYGSEH